MTNKRIVVTGVNGFVGEHLANQLKQGGYSVIGVGREEMANNNVQQYIEEYYTADLLNTESVNILEFGNARAIIHLAGLASVAESFDKPDLYKTGNAIMTDNILSTAVNQGFTGRAVVISTGALYDPHQPLPLSEDSKTTENSPYATGKVAAEQVVKNYAKKGLDVVLVRPFNHIGPGQGPGFLVPDLYQQLTDARDNGKTEIITGNIDTRRDYTDVRDIAKAYVALAIAPKLNYSLYNVASGSSISGREILQALTNLLDLTDIFPTIDPTKVRPNDPVELVGDSSRIQQELGWLPIINIKQTVFDFVANKENSSILS